MGEAFTIPAVAGRRIERALAFVRAGAADDEPAVLALLLSDGRWHHTSLDPSGVVTWIAWTTLLEEPGTRAIELPALGGEIIESVEADAALTVRLRSGRVLRLSPRGAGAVLSLV